MLLGGLWHGASWNFIIWGGLNGIGLVVYQFWKELSWWIKALNVSIVTLILGLLCKFSPAPVWRLLFVWAGVIAAGTLVRFIYHLFKGKGCKTLGYVWGVVQTFTFITFTRLFFRSGSNLDPDVANEEAWKTAKNMVNQIGSAWDLSLIPEICASYWNVFLLVVLGMVIHWLPERFKRWYRMNFALLPLPLMALVVVAAAFIAYQFITADLQAFIYFQF